MNTIDIVENYIEYIIELRRFFHQIPEAGFHEIKTTEKIIEELEKYSISYNRCSKTGVIAQIDGTPNKKTLGLRADIDALPIIEENDCDYKSLHPEMMHACGHDCHIAMLLATARILKENQHLLNGNVRLIFQPAEEGSELGQGASYMIKEGALENVNSMFGMHVMPEIEAGKIAVMPGPIMASTDEFEIVVTGSSGHGATPQYCVDSVVVASAIVMNLQTVVSRQISPLETAVISIGTINGGSRWNVIAGEVKLTGTVRTFSHKLGQEIPGIIKRMIDSTAQSYNASIKFTYKNNVKATINDEHCIKIVKESIQKLYGTEALTTVEKQMGGEDFSEYANLVPSAFCFLGVGNTQKNTYYPLHNSKFTVDEDALPIGVATFVQYAVDYFNNKHKMSI